MRSYLIDEIAKADVKKAAAHLEAMELAGGLDGIFWLPLPQELLTEEQKEHAEECGPHCMALECDADWIKLELLVRARNKLRCSCVAYATPAQRAHAMDYLDNMLKELDISV